MDLAAKIVIALSALLGLTVFAIPLYHGINIYSLAAAISFGAIGIYLLFFANTPLRANAYKTLPTAWSKKARESLSHQEYPRPQLVRDQWTNLNGLWEFAICPFDQEKPGHFDGTIKVPFPLESSLSGIKNARINHKQKLWYRRNFTLEQSSIDTLMLHFGAVDWKTEVWVNGHYVGQHEGGHNAFSFDISDYLGKHKNESRHEILVSVWDPTNKGTQPRGKQLLRPSNIYYTPVTGIWQTVWLEPLAKTYINELTIKTDIDKQFADIKIDVENPSTNDRISVAAFDHGEFIGEAFFSDGVARLSLPENIELWSPDNPKLYDLEIQIERKSEIIDKVCSYFSLRKIEIKKDKRGINRIHLNNNAMFQLGLLDQGWWPDGLYTAPGDEALKYDIEVTKAMGFNMIRKHVKVEPARWYYHCDKIGMLVWQDMPTGDKNILPKQKDITRTKESAKIFHRELEAMMCQLDFFQCVVCWVPFNEGWGQFNTNSILKKVKNIDPSRLVDGPSGWVDRGQGDMRDYHIYNRKLFIEKPEQKRALVIGEFGGIGFRMSEHMAVTNSWSYNNAKSREHLAKRYEKLFKEQLAPLLAKGLAAAVYTQTTDVESEINGLLSYDREVIKINTNRIKAINKSMYEIFNSCV